MGVTVAPMVIPSDQAPAERAGGFKVAVRMNRAVRAEKSDSATLMMKAAEDGL